MTQFAPLDTTCPSCSNRKSLVLTVAYPDLRNWKMMMQKRRLFISVCFREAKRDTDAKWRTQKYFRDYVLMLGFFCSGLKRPFCEANAVSFASNSLYFACPAQTHVTISPDLIWTNSGWTQTPDNIRTPLHRR